MKPKPPGAMTTISVEQQNEILEIYGGLSDWKLDRLTHFIETAKYPFPQDEDGIELDRFTQMEYNDLMKFLKSPLMMMSERPEDETFTIDLQVAKTLEPLLYQCIETKVNDLSRDVLHLQSSYHSAAAPPTPATLTPMIPVRATGLRALAKTASTSAFVGYPEPRSEQRDMYLSSFGSSIESLYDNLESFSKEVAICFNHDGFFATPNLSSKESRSAAFAHPILQKFGPIFKTAVMSANRAVANVFGSTLQNIVFVPSIASEDLRKDSPYAYDKDRAFQVTPLKSLSTGYVNLTARIQFDTPSACPLFVSVGQYNAFLDHHCLVFQFDHASVSSMSFESFASSIGTQVSGLCLQILMEKYPAVSKLPSIGLLLSQMMQCIQTDVIQAGHLAMTNAKRMETAIAATVTFFAEPEPVVAAAPMPAVTAAFVLAEDAPFVMPILADDTEKLKFNSLGVKAMTNPQEKHDAFYRLVRHKIYKKRFGRPDSKMHGGPRSGPSYEHMRKIGFEKELEEAKENGIPKHHLIQFLQGLGRPDLVPESFGGPAPVKKSRKRKTGPVGSGIPSGAGDSDSDTYDFDTVGYDAVVGQKRDRDGSPSAKLMTFEERHAALAALGGPELYEDS